MRFRQCRKTIIKKQTAGKNRKRHVKLFLQRAGNNRKRQVKRFLQTAGNNRKLRAKLFLLHPYSCLCLHCPAFCLYLQHIKQTSMPPAEFEPATPASDRPQTLALDRSATELSVFHENPTKDLVADTGSQTQGQTWCTSMFFYNA
jgi:hypothetical protein